MFYFIMHVVLSIHLFQLCTHIYGVGVCYRATLCPLTLLFQTEI